MKPEISIEDTLMAKYRIGAVCRITGLSPHVLRVWEKRYGVVKPKRLANNRRLYSDQDLGKLIQLKALVDDGHAIGSIAGLAPEELEQRARTASRMRPMLEPDFKPRTMVVGETLTIGKGWQNQQMLDVVATAGDMADARQMIDPDGYDLILVEVHGIQDDIALELVRFREKMNARLLVVIYNYASKGALRALIDNPNVVILCGHNDFELIASIVLPKFGADLRKSQSGEKPVLRKTRQFTERQLAYIACQSASLECECPSHLSGLVAGLVRFEVYSAECANRNAQDAVIHRSLHEATSEARQLMESALQQLVEFENIEVHS